jgi:hypothetical protein
MQLTQAGVSSIITKKALAKSQRMPETLPVWSTQSMFWTFDISAVLRPRLSLVGFWSRDTKVNRSVISLWRWVGIYKHASPSHPVAGSENIAACRFADALQQGRVTHHNHYGSYRSAVFGASTTVGMWDRRCKCKPNCRLSFGYSHRHEG